MKTHPSSQDKGDATLPSLLRQATRALHHRIDHHPLLTPLVRQELTLAHYLRILEFFQRFYEAVQPVLEETIRRFGCDYPLGDRLAWLNADFADLHHCNSLPPLGMEVPPLNRRPELVGWLYVIEGSTQGGQVIARQLQVSLQLTASQGARFFNGWGEDTARHWRDFWCFANAQCPPASYGIATASALDLFVLLEKALDIAYARD